MPTFTLTIGQLDQALDLASKGATMGGQALLFFFLIVMGWVVRSMHSANKSQTQETLKAHERQHSELLSALNAERTSNDLDRKTNHDALMRVAMESAAGLQATAASNISLATALNSLRETFHGLREEMQVRKSERYLANDKQN